MCPLSQRTMTCSFGERGSSALCQTFDTWHWLSPCSHICHNETYLQRVGRAYEVLEDLLVQEQVWGWGFRDGRIRFGG